MKVFAQWGISVSILFYALIHFISYFIENSTAHLLLSVFGLGIMIFSMFLLTIHKLKLPLSLTMIGMIILFVSDASILEGVQEGFIQMRNVIGLLIVVPMISWVLREEPYIESIIGLGHKFLNTSRKFYLGVISFTQILSYFLLFGSIQMGYYFVNEILKDKKGEAWENFKGTALLRGFALASLWVVSIASFAFVVEITEASLFKTILQGLGVSIVGVCLALIFSHIEEKKYGIDLSEGLRSVLDEVLDGHTNTKRMKADLLEFGILFLTLFGSVFLLQALLPVEILVLIPLVVLVWIGLYYVYKRRLDKLVEHVKVYFKRDIVNQSYQVCMMLGAGMMIFALNQTNFAQVVVDGIYGLQDIIPFMNILYVLPLMVVILGFAGLGPLTVMVLVGGIVSGLDLPYPPEIIVLAITSGSAMSVLLSPLIMASITLSSLNGLNSLKNTIEFNWKYALALYVIVQVYVQWMI